MTATGFGLPAICTLMALLLTICFSTHASAQSDIAGSCERLAQECPDAVIGEINIIHLDVFEASDPLPVWFPRKTVNALHMDTTDETIREYLLFKTGEPMNVELIRETQRKLNDLGMFRDEKLTCVQMEPGKVRVDVSVKENWSLIPIFDVQGKGLGQTVTMGVTEQNLLGLGKVLSFSYRNGARDGNTIIEDAWTLAYEDPNILGSRYGLSWFIQGLESGEILSATFEKPYFSLETPWALTLTNTHSRRARYLFQAGDVAARYIQQNNVSGLNIGYALKRGPPVVHRVGFFYQYEQQGIQDFQGVAGTTANLAPPPGFTYSYPGIGYQRLGVDYIMERRINRFQRSEYINLANELRASIGFSAKTLGADRDEWIFIFSDAQGYRFRKGHFLLMNASAQGIWVDERLRNGIFDFSYDHYLRNTFLDCGPLWHTLHLHGNFRYGENLDSNKRFGLGYDSGLRGYEIDAFTGNKLLRITLEDRIFVKKDILGLVALGVLLFWDCGYVWEEGQEVDLGDLRNDVGFGLRTAIPSATGGNVVQLDWGFPAGSGASPLEEVVFTIRVSSTFD